MEAAAKVKTRVEIWVEYISIAFGATALSVAAAALVIKDPVVLLLSLLAWVVCLLGLCCALYLLYRTVRSKRALRSDVILTGVVSALFVGATILSLSLVWTWAYDLSSRTVSQANLKGLSHALNCYCEEHKAYPPTLEHIMRTDRVSHNAVVAPSDPHAPAVGFSGGRLVYSSYVYVPGVGPRVHDENVILLYEREPYGTRRFGQRFRNVMYDDGYLECLTEEGFREVMEKDQQRRRELGWLTTQSAPGE